EQAALAARTRLRDAGQGRRDCAGLRDQAEAAVALGDQHAAVGEEGEAPGVIEAARERLDAEAHAEALLGDAGLAGEGRGLAVRLRARLSNRRARGAGRCAGGGLAAAGKGEGAQQGRPGRQLEAHDITPYKPHLASRGWVAQMVRAVDS